MYIYILAYVFACIYMSYVPTHTRTHAHTHIRTYLHTHTHIHEHIHTPTICMMMVFESDYSVTYLGTRVSLPGGHLLNMSLIFAHLLANAISSHLYKVHSMMGLKKTIINTTRTVVG